MATKLKTSTLLLLSSTILCSNTNAASSLPGNLMDAIGKHSVQNLSIQELKILKLTNKGFAFAADQEIMKRPLTINMASLTAQDIPDFVAFLQRLKSTSIMLKNVNRDILLPVLKALPIDFKFNMVRDLKISLVQMAAQDFPIANVLYSFQGLTSLDLSCNFIGNDGAIAIAESPSMAGLTSLNLSCNFIGEEWAIAIAESHNLQGLTTLNLSNNYIGDEGAIAIAQSFHMQILNSLNLSRNYIGADGAIAIAKSSSMARLTSLDLSCNFIEDEGAIAISESPNLQRLTSLNFVNNNIGAAGAVAIGSSPYLAKARDADGIEF